MDSEEHRPLNYAGLALAMVVAAVGIVAINLFSSGDFVESALLKRARAHFSDSLVSQRWLRHDNGIDTEAVALAVPPATTISGIAEGSHRQRIVGNNPLNPTHSPNAWESDALERFAAGSREKFDHRRTAEVTEFRYMAPIFFEAACLSCHSKQGVKAGDVAGGVLISFDAADTDRYFFNNAIATGIAIVLIMLGVGQVIAMSVRRVRASGRMTDIERERFESLVHTLDGVVWEADPTTLQFSFVSRRAKSLLGYPLDDWLKPGFWLSRLHPKDRVKVLAQRQEDAHKLEPTALEYRLVGKDGKTVWVHDRSALMLRDGKAGVLRGIMIDSTVRKKAEIEAGKLLRAVEQSPVSIVITNRDGLIEYANPRFSQVFGFTREEAMGQNPRILQSGETAHAVYEELWRTIQAGREWRGRLKNRKKNGDTIWEDVSIAPVFAENGEITHFLAVKEDVTERLRVERELADYRSNLEEQVLARTEALQMAVQRATAADRAKSEFLTNMSHEIRTPLNAVIGFCELVQRTELSPRQRDYLEKIDGAGQHLLQLINNLLDLSKIAAGKVEISVEAFDLPQIVARINSVFSFKATEKGLEFGVAIDPEIPRRLLGDALRVNQVLINLINNAIKFTKTGKVQLAVRCLHRDAQFLRIQFSIEDTGIGMDAAELQRAFEPFSQADASISRKFGGTGLGLSISRDLVGLMGGQLEVVSDKGKGSRFFFTLDFSCPDVGATEGAVAGLPGELPKDEMYRFDALRVLLVDDQELNRVVASEMMAACGIGVEMATNGREAVDRLFAEGPEAFDVVLMDLQMPEFDGLSAMRAIRAQEGYEKIPLIAMTAHVLEEERRRAAAAGANGHLGKPFHSAQLYEVLARFAPAEKVQRIPKSAATLETPSLPAPEPAPLASVPESPIEPLASDAVLDWNDGMERFGRAEKYMNWLNKFVAERCRTVDDIAALLKEGKAQEAAQQAHALKGVAGMLALKRAFTAARDLELACRALAAGTREGDVEEEVAQLRLAMLEAFGRIAELGSPASE